MKKRYALVLDASGSMAGIINDARNLANETIRNIFASESEAEVTVITFSSGQIDVLARNVSKKFTVGQEYQAGGGTPLFKAVVRAVDEIATRGGLYTVVTITDGQDTDGELSRFQDVLKKKTATDKWTFAFMLPPYYVDSFKNLSGVPAGNIKGWTDIKVAAQDLVVATTTHTSRGSVATKNFFTVDASKLKTRGLRDITDEVKVYTATREETLDKLVSARTRRDYVKGEAYYQLTKKERKVQPDKIILVQDKTTKRVFFDGREKLGLPTDQDVKLEPGNLGNFDVFILSKSVGNPRIIPRGAKFLVWPAGVKELVNA